MATGFPMGAVRNTNEQIKRPSRGGTPSNVPNTRKLIKPLPMPPQRRGRLTGSEPPMPRMRPGPAPMGLDSGVAPPNQMVQPPMMAQEAVMQRSEPPTVMKKGGMVKAYAKGGYVNCGASVPPAQKGKK